MGGKKIIISRTDSIGDVMLTFPVAGVLKEHLPDCEIIFLGQSYTKDIIAACRHIDQFVAWDTLLETGHDQSLDFFRKINADLIIHVLPVKKIAYLAKKAKIPLRIGSTGRYYHYFTCNRLVPLSRKRSSLHEAQLNLRLIKSTGIKDDYSFKEIAEYFGFASPNALKGEIDQLTVKDKFNLIIHPKSKGSAREWGLKNFSDLIKILPGDKFRIFITGTKAEGDSMKPELIRLHPECIDMTGRLSLKELIRFINEADGLVAASTGPLHIAAALGKFALGLYPPIKPMHPGRWAPIGNKAEFIVLDKKCSKCRKNKHCECLEQITPEIVKNKLLNWIHVQNK